MRYVEIDGQLRKVMVVIKMRGGNHSKDIREYVITDKGVVIILPRKTEYAGADHRDTAANRPSGRGRAGTEGEDVRLFMGETDSRRDARHRATSRRNAGDERGVDGRIGAPA